MNTPQLSHDDACHLSRIFNAAEGRVSGRGRERRIRHRAALLALTENRDVHLVHNGRTYEISPETLIDGLYECEKKAEAPC